MSIAWKNVWRNRGRSLVVVGAIIVGLWTLIFCKGFMNSFLESYMNDAIKYDVSHMQIHRPEFKKDFEIRYTLDQADEMVAFLEKESEVKAFSRRSMANGMIASARKSGGIQVYGIYPEEEARLTELDSLVTDGAYFEGIKRNPILIGKKLADQMKVKVRSKIVFTTQDKDGEIVALAFRIVGLIEGNSPKLNEFSAYVRMEDLNPLLGIGDQYHQIAVIMDPDEGVDALAATINGQFPSNLAESWRILAPELEYMIEMYDSFLWILMLVIMVALIFGIINTMLMAVLERIKELGMLMAIGMNKKKVFSMVMMETIFLALVACPLGLAAGYFTIAYFAQAGLDLSAYSEGLESFGTASILYPSVEGIVYVQLTLGVVVTALVGALYPAWKAIRLEPVEALHKI